MTEMFFINLEIESDERFDLAKFMDYSDDLKGVAAGRFDPLTSFFLRELPKLRSRGQYAIQVEEFRPDQISFKFFGTTEYWWVIMSYNNMLSIEELTTGTILEIPSEESMSQLFFRLRALDQAKEL